MRSLLVVILAFTALACYKTIYEVRTTSPSHPSSPTTLAQDTSPRAQLTIKN
jgi:hypothetical protein